MELLNLLGVDLDTLDRLIEEEKRNRKIAIVNYELPECYQYSDNSYIMCVDKPIKVSIEFYYKESTIEKIKDLLKRKNIFLKSKHYSSEAPQIDSNNLFRQLVDKVVKDYLSLGKYKGKTIIIPPSYIFNEHKYDITAIQELGENLVIRSILGFYIKGIDLIGIKNDQEYIASLNRNPFNCYPYAKESLLIHELIHYLIENPAVSETEGIRAFIDREAKSKGYPRMFIEEIIVNYLTKKILEKNNL